ncbi:MAG: response regulator [Nevskia sp.]|nr:response regulator [Nevskia sp.]
MIRVLFVDDEAAVLTGLRNSLRKQRGEWDMVFVDSGERALEELAKNPFDLVVTDMRMPQMDGAQLLARVKVQYPATGRIVLSGHAEQAAIIRTLPVAHQFLTKPCEPEHLRQVIERVCSLNALMHEQAVRQIIGSVDKLPSVPATYSALNRAMAKADINMSEVARIVEQDPAICVKLLQLVNSAYFGLGRQMTSILQAVTYLGMELLRSLVLSVNIFATLDQSRLGGLNLEEIQQRSLQMGRLMRRFLADTRLVEEAFTTALVHDVGRIVLALGLGERYAAVMERAHAEGVPSHLVEKQVLGASHAEIGAYLLGVWGLPFQVVEAVAYHHRPGDMPLRDEGLLLGALHAADVLVPCVGATVTDEGGGLDREFLERAGCLEQMPRWQEIAAEELGGVKH